MARDPLLSLVKVRRRACDEAQHQLVRRLEAETRAKHAVHDIERGIASEMDVAADVASPDSVVEAFGAWLPGARRQLDDARHLLHTAEAESGRARAELTASRVALETVELLVKSRLDAAKIADNRAQQRELDDRPTTRSDDARPRSC